MISTGNIVVGTPGRLEALFEDRNSPVDIARRVKSLEVLILDEADRLLDMGFEASINTILSYLPRQRRTGLFSATQTGNYTTQVLPGIKTKKMNNFKGNDVHMLSMMFAILHYDQRMN